jgi:hypothetical protein
MYKWQSWGTPISISHRIRTIMAAITPVSKPVALEELGEMDVKGSVQHMEAIANSDDPKIRALQSDIDALQHMTPEAYEALHKQLVRKVGRLLFEAQADIRLIPHTCLCSLYSSFSIISTGMLLRE